MRVVMTQLGGAGRQDAVVTVQFVYVFFQIDMTSEKSKILSRTNRVKAGCSKDKHGLSCERLPSLTL